MTRISPALAARPAAAALALAAAAAGAALPRPEGVAFHKGAVFAVAGYTNAAPLSGFPVLVRVDTNSPAGFAYADLHSPTNGADLAFVGMDGAGLPFEIDTWDTNGTSLVWVRLPSMTNGTQFAMCWGSTASGKTVCPGNPFADYYGVWHMNEANARDSTANHLDGTADPSVAIIDAKLGTGANFPSDAGSSTGIRTTNTLNSAFSSAISFETWARPSVVNQERAFFGKEALATFKIKNGTTWFTTPGRTDFGGVNAPLAADTWHHLVVTFVPGQSAKVYVNGQLAKTQTDSGDKPGFNNLNLSCPVVIGGNQWPAQYYRGVLDECRLLTTELSADWIAADYATQNDPAFLSAGEAEPYVEPPSPTASLSVPSVGFANATIEIAVTGLGAGAASADVTLEVSATDDFSVLLRSETQSTSVKGTRSFAIAGLATNSTYHARAFVTNDLHAATAIGPVSFTTLEPAAPAMEASFGGRTGSSLAATVLVSSSGADSATIRIEASADGFETIAAASAPVAAVPGQPTEVTVGGLEPLTSYDLRVVVRNDWGIETVAVLGRFATLPASGLAELYVDSLGSGDGSSPESALPTIREALDRAAAGYTIWVRGGADRAYGVTNDVDALPIPEELAGLSIRAYAETPGDGGRALVAISDTYVDDGNRAHIVSNRAANVTVSGLDFAFGTHSVGRQNVGGCSILWTAAPFTTLENCLLRMPRPTNFAGSGASSPLVFCVSREATNLVVRGCEFLNTRCWSSNHGYAPIKAKSNALIAGNVFSNVNSTATAQQADLVNGGEQACHNFSFVSNVVYGANGGGNLSSGFLFGLYPGPKSAEIAFNRFVAKPDAPAADGGNSVVTHRVNLTFGGQFAEAFSGKEATLVHHNTIIGGRSAFLFGDGEKAKRKNQFFSNLVVLDPDGTNLVDSSSVTAFSDGRTTSFIGPSCLRNNAYTGVLTGGTATQIPNYDLAGGLEIADNIALSAPPEFVCTNDIYSADFYRYRSARNASGDLGVLGWDVSPREYPLWIGALPPLYPPATMLILK